MSTTTMLPLPTLQNLPNNPFSPLGNAVPAANTGASRPAPGAASFGKVLAQEINDKYDAPKNSSVEANSTPVPMAAATTATNTASNNAPENENAVVDDSNELKDVTDLKDIRALKDLKDLKDLRDWKDLKDLTDLKDSKDSKDSKDLAGKINETKTDTTAIATSSGQMDLANILHGLIAAYSPDSQTGAQAAAATEIPADVRTDPSVDAPAERISTAAQYAGLAHLQPRLAAAHTSQAGTDADASAALQPAADGDPTLLTPGVPTAGATASASVKRAVEAQDIHQGARKGAEIKLELGARRSDPQQTGFGLSERSLSVETGMLGRSLPELLPQSTQGLYGEGVHVEGLQIEGLPTAGLPNTSAMPTVIAAEHGIVPAASGAGVQPAPWLEPRIGAAGWDNALGQKVLWMVSNQLQVAELNLNPPDLGPLQVVLSISNDQASATFVSQHVDVRQALEAALPRLKEMMAESGISLGNTTVSADTPQQQGGFERQDRSAPRQDQGGGGETMSMSNANSADVGMSRIHKDESRLVDTFA